MCDNKKPTKERFEGNYALQCAQECPPAPGATNWDCNLCIVAAIYNDNPLDGE